MAKEKLDKRLQVLTTRWIQAMFRRYYENAELTLPDKFARREFGFMFFDGSMVQRHIGFTNVSNLKEYLIKRTPAHVYHSSAYYKIPDAPTMEEKEWLGADLIFDLDADHITRVKGMPYEEMLEEVKTETKKIVDQYLLGDFGLDEKNIMISFSGGRGYHITAKDPRLWTLGSHERREIVDYITGTEIDEEASIHKEVYEVSPWGSKYRYTAPSMGETGWKKRIWKGIVDAVERLESMGKTEAIKYICSFEGIGRKTADVIYETLLGGDKGNRGIDELRKQNIDIFPSDRYLEHFKKVFFKVAIDLGRSETDEPVTSDIKRLIRMVSSLHGKTGMMVVRMSRDELDNFKPLRDAFPQSFRDHPTKVDIIKSANVRLRGETFNLKQGLTEIPEYAAVFFACRGLATIPQVSP